MSASEIANALGGHKAGAGRMARCPAHNDRTPSLSICDAEDNKVLVRCHAGCEQERVITTLRTRGLWTNNSPRSHPTQRSNVQHKPDKDDAKRTEVALTIWKDTKSAGNTVVESYLASRGLHLLPPPTLRFHGFVQGDGSAADRSGHGG
jgi:putative DNA primase/helicase